MKTLIRSVRSSGFGRLILPLILWISLFSTQAYAGEAPGDFRSVYDIVMRWVNFLILAFILIKFGKTPLMNFLHAQKDETESEIQRLEKEKKKALAKVDETKKMIRESDKRFKALSERIVAQGEERKLAIIEDARRESLLMIEDARQKIDSRLHHAKANFKSELVDAAMAIAARRLVGELTPEDEDKFTARFMDGIEA